MKIVEKGKAEQEYRIKCGFCECVFDAQKEEAVEHFRFTNEEVFKGEYFFERYIYDTVIVSANCPFCGHETFSELKDNKRVEVTRIKNKY